MSVDLSIVIVNWNTRELLAGCLESIALNVPTFQRSNVETFVVDNASADGSAAMVRERFPWVRLIENSDNVGFARANNQGIHLASGQYILLLNPDTEVRFSALRSLVDFLATHPTAGAVGGRLLTGEGGLQASCHPMLTPAREFWRLLGLDSVWPLATYRMGSWSQSAPHPVEVICGACLLLRRAALDQVGLLDETYFMYTEEVDLCYRLARAGWELWWAPQAEVVHYGGASSKQIAEAMYLQLYRSKVQFYRKFGGEFYAGQFKLFLRLAYAPRLVIATLAGIASPRLMKQAHTYRRLLAEVASW